MKKILEKYNFLWVLYFFFTAGVQLLTLIKIIPFLSHATIFNIWDIIIAPLYLFSLGVFVFRKKLFTATIWKVIFAIILLDIPITLFRGISGDNFVLPAQCQSGQVFCTITFLTTFVGSLAKVMPLYYALAKLSFPKFEIPFTPYPVIAIRHNTKPNRFFAFPIFGIVVKSFILIPFFIVSFVITFVAGLFQLINAFVVLFTGKIWMPAYRFSLWAVKLSLSVSAYMYGLTDTYPSFGSKIEDSKIALDYTKPEKSNRLFAIPVLGLLFRYLLLLPFLTYVSYIGFAAMFGQVIGSFSVLFKGKYPQSVHELSQDTIRLNASSQLYFYGMSDTYPSFAISLSHPVKKFLLLGAVLILQILMGLGVANVTKAFQGMSTVSPNMDTLSKQSFMKSCDTTGKSTAYCACVYNGLTAKYTFFQIQTMVTQFQQTQKVPDQMASIMKTCNVYLPK